MVYIEKICKDWFMAGDGWVTDVDEGVTKFSKVCRNFNVGNRVSIYFEGKFYSGKIVEKKIRRYNSPLLTIKTDEKVEGGELLGGYGLQGPAYGREPLFFEGEQLPNGDESYRTIIEQELTEAEIVKLKQYEDSPF